LVRLMIKSILKEIKKHKEQQDAIQNVASVARLILRTEAIVSEKPEKKLAPAMPRG